MKRFMLTIALTCVLAIPALAGQVPTGGEPQPQPLGITPTTSEPSPGEVPTVGFTDQVSDAALSGLLAVLDLLVV
ncbi:MAG: hypothetical protein QOD33_951 [Pyrinomonadaceae bacterium]|jgi:hypothetical protein|nr:hypothetical protein [Pyrinomonadaceae bacterium]